MSFRLVPKSVTLNDLERRNGRYIALFHWIWSTCVAENDLWQNLCKSLLHFSACTTSSQRKFTFAISSPDEFLVIKMVEHLSNAIDWHAIHAWWRKTSILDVWHPSGLTSMVDTVIAKCVQNRQLNALFPFLVLFDTHILSFYEWNEMNEWMKSSLTLTVIRW